MALLNGLAPSSYGGQRETFSHQLPLLELYNKESVEQAILL